MKPDKIAYDVTVSNEDVNHEYCNKTLQMEEGARMLYLLLGKRLHTIRETRCYEPFWADWDTFCMEFKDLSPSAISKIIKVYESLVLGFGFTEEELIKAGGWTKLYEIARRAGDKKTAEKWIHAAEHLSRSDLAKQFVEATTGVVSAECEHKDAYVIKVCPDCGHKEKVYA